jgi:hypothetical protein
VRLGQRDRGGVDPSRQRVEGTTDHLGLVERDRAVAHPCRQDRTLKVQSRCQSEVGVRGAEPRTCLVRQPRRGVLRPGRVGQVARVGQHPQPKLRQLPLCPHQLAQRGRLVVGRHECRVHAREALEEGPDLGDSSNDRVTHGWPPFDDGSPHAPARVRFYGRRSWRPGSPDDYVTLATRSADSGWRTGGLSWWPGDHWSVLSRYP